MKYQFRCERCVYSEAFIDVEADSIDEAIEIAELKKDFANYNDYDETFHLHDMSNTFNLHKVS